MPQEKFHSIKTNEDLDNFFDSNFPDAVDLIGRQRLHSEYFSNEKGSLISIKCSPYNYKDKAVIVGDAAHAMVPFFGQGLNCGFEDVELLMSMIDTSPTVETALNRYSESRSEDAATACDLAMYNYIEMRSLVRSPMHRIRHWIESHLVGFTPLYEMVTFSHMRYSEARRKWKRQRRVVEVAGLTLSLVGLFMLWRFNLPKPQPILPNSRTLVINIPHSLTPRNLMSSISQKINNLF